MGVEPSHVGGIVIPNGHRQDHATLVSFCCRLPGGKGKMECFILSFFYNRAGPVWVGKKRQTKKEQKVLAIN